jgi:peptide/nickel transport system permease protein
VTEFLCAVGRRLLRVVLLLWIVSVISFLALRLTPGDPAALLLGPAAANQDNAALVASIQHRLGLDRPIVVQYGSWLNQLLHGDFGNSNQSGTSVIHLVLNAAPTTAWLIALSVAIAVPVSIVLGMFAAQHASLSWVLRLLSGLAMATPGFWVGLLLIIVVCVRLNLLPSAGYVSPTQSVGQFVSHLVLPVVTLSIYLIGTLTRFIYSEAQEAKSADYVRTAVAMGISTRRITWVYVLRNAVLPAITVVGVQAGTLVGGAVLVEQVFGLGGVGQLMLQGVLNRDYPVVQGAVLLATFVVILSTTAAEVLRAAVDPRTS